MKHTEVENRIHSNRIDSNLICPSYAEYERICIINKDWLLKRLSMHYNTDIINIHNMYVIVFKDRLYYNHDGNIWLIESKDPKEELVKYRLTNDAEDRVSIDISITNYDALRFTHIFSLLNNKRDKDGFAPIIRIRPYNELKSYEL